MRTRALIFVALAACSQSTATTQQVLVLAPLSGADASRGDAVLNAASVVNQVLAQSTVFTPTLEFHVVDSNRDAAGLQELAARAKGASIVIAGGCPEADAINQQFGATPPLTLVLFCDTIAARASIEAKANADNYFFWVGPLQVSFVRGLDAWLRDDDRDAQSQQKIYDSGNFLYAAGSEAAIPDVLQAVSDLTRHGIPTTLIPIGNSSSTEVVDYVPALASLRQQAASNRFSYVFTPFLTSLELIRQANVLYGNDGFATARSDWLLPIDYQVGQASAALAPFTIAGGEVVSWSGAVSLPGFTALEALYQKNFSTSARSMVTRLTVDTLSAAALTLARSAHASPSEARSNFLKVTQPPATSTDFSELLPALTSASKGAALDYDGVFSTFDVFDRFGRLAGDFKIGINLATTANDGLGASNNQYDVLLDPLQGKAIDIKAAFEKNCITSEAPPGTLPWSKDFIQIYDRSKLTGVVHYVNPPQTTGINLHFNQPVQITSVNFQHFRSLYSLVHTILQTRLFWWRDALPVGFDFRAPPEAADGSLTTPYVNIGPWFSADWSFEAKPVQTLTVLADYLQPDVTEQVFNDMEIFLTDESYASFCK